MLRRTPKITSILQQGGPFTGDNKPTTRITVEPGWFLNVSTGPVGNFPSSKLPIRWWQSALGNGTEIEVPNIKTVIIDRSLTQDAATIEIDFYNTATPADGSAGDNSDTFGDRGYLCVDESTEALSDHGWVKWNELNVGDSIWTLNPNTGIAEWKPVKKVNSYKYDGLMNYIGNSRWNALVTPGHRWPILRRRIKSGPKYDFRAHEDLLDNHYLPASAPADGPDFEIFPDWFVKLCGWVITEGTYEPRRVRIFQSHTANPEYCKEIEQIFLDSGLPMSNSDGCFGKKEKHFKGMERSSSWSLYRGKKGVSQWRIYGDIAKQLKIAVPLIPGAFREDSVQQKQNKVFDITFLRMLSVRQRQMLLHTCWLGDGTKNRWGNRLNVTTVSKDQADSYQLLSVLAGSGSRLVTKEINSSIEGKKYSGSIYQLNVRTARDIMVRECEQEKVRYKGMVWCPTTDNQTFLARRDGVTFFTGNSPFHGNTELSHLKWNQSPNSWFNILRENSLCRCYQGYGGLTNPDGSIKTLEEAIADGSLMLTGVFLIDTIAIEAQTGIGKLVGRDMAKLLIDQPCWYPLIPQGTITSAGIVYYHNQIVTDAPVTTYGSDGSAPVPTSLPYSGVTAWKSIGITAPLEGNFPESIYDIAIMPDGEGYRLLGSDGGVFDYGTAGFSGSEGNKKLAKKAVSLENTPSGNGYWIAAADGGVFAFGDAGFYGSLAGITLAAPIVSIRRSLSGNGYWMCGADGGIFTFGDAQFYGSLPSDHISDTIQAFAVRPQGDGYWLLATSGAVYSYGGAHYHGGLNTTTPNPLSDGGIPEAIDSAGDGNGYRILTSSGGVFDYGSAVYHTLTGGSHSNTGVSGLAEIELFAPASSIRRTPDDRGFFVVGMDGGVFTFGDANFHGALPALYQISVKGNYNDYADIISDMLLWAGFYLKDYPVPNTARPPVFGIIESTGAYNSVGPLDPSIFDKVQIIDIIKKIRDTIGAYIFRIREDGSAYFSAANIWQIGNFFDDLTPTPEIPVIDERLNMTDYILTNTDQTLRSEIIVSPVDPYLFGGHPAAGPGQTITVTRLVPNGIEALRGMQKPAMIIVPLNVPVSKEDQDLIAELQALFCWLGVRTGQISCVVDPAICPDDQIRIFERSTGETGIHYVVGVHTEHDLDSGTWIATYTTQWMGDQGAWSITSSWDSLFGLSPGGTITDTTFGPDGNLIFQNSFPISDTLAQALANTGTHTTSRFRVTNPGSTATGSPTI